MSITIFHSAALDDVQRGLIADAAPGELHERAEHWRLETTAPLPGEVVAQLREALPFDVNPLPDDFEPAAVRLLISDMDSTLINIECVDEIADFAGRKPEVAAITEAAMRGEIDFSTSLRRRVDALAGLDESVLAQVYDERLRLNPGAEGLLAGARQRGIKLALVSGGFTFFTERLQQRLGLDFTRANLLETDAGRLTGKVIGEIVDGDVKAAFLQELCDELGIAPAQSVAMGDGANDLKMMGLAGLGVAYRAKPTVQAQSDIVLNHNPLDAVLHLLA